MKEIQLTPHFQLQEFTKSATARDHGIKNNPAPEHVENLRALCVNTLEPLREAMGLPIIITSGYRCKALNHFLVNHSVKSQHMNGEAADFYVSWNGSKDEEPSRRELLIKAFRQMILDENISFDQLILYPKLIHASFTSRRKNRRKLTRGFSNGTYAALSLSGSNA